MKLFENKNFFFPENLIFFYTFGFCEKSFHFLVVNFFLDICILQVYFVDQHFIISVYDVSLYFYYFLHYKLRYLFYVRFSYVALSYFTVFLPFNMCLLCARLYHIFLPISSTSFLGCRRIHRFFA